MKRKIVYLLLLGCVVLTGCLKDGFDDFKVKNPHLVGQFRPELGIPIGTGELTVEDLTEMYTLFGDSATLEVTDDSITIVVNTKFQSDIPVESAKKKASVTEKGVRSHRKAPGDTTVLYTSHKWMEGNSIVDIFDQFDLSSDIDIKAAYVTLGANISADAPGYDPANDPNHVEVYFDSLYILYQHNGVTETLVEILDSISVVDFTQGSQHVQLMENKEVSSLLRDRSSILEFRARMNIQFEYSFNYLDPTLKPLDKDSVDKYIYEEIGLTEFHVDAEVNARIPLALYATNLKVSKDIEFSASFDTIELELDSSFLYLECANGIPMGLVISGDLIDENGNKIRTLFNNNEIAAAKTRYEVSSDTYITKEPSESLITIFVTKDLFDDVKKASGLRLNASISTAETGDSANKIVSLRKDDKMDLRFYAKVRPIYNMNFSLGSEGDESKKGGKR